MRAYPSTFNLRHKYEHQLVLVDERVDPENDSAGESHKRSDGGEHDRDSTHEKLHKISSEPPYFVDPFGVRTMFALKSQIVNKAIESAEINKLTSR